MSGDSPDLFVDNWAYLKAELNWLDRVLMLAVARQRKETKEIERVAQSRADRVSSHWWKGLITLEEEAAYDDTSHRKVQASTGSKLNYQQQIEARIEASHRQGLFLALPALRNRLQLTTFEKNLIVMGLAPEVNRRYVRLYSYLQSQDVYAETGTTHESRRHATVATRGQSPSDFPTMDLVLRMLCRNDTEWRTARSLMVSGSVLIQHQLVELLATGEETFLNQRLKLSDRLVNYLFSENSNQQGLESLLQPPQPTSPVGSATIQRSYLQMIATPKTAAVPKKAAVQLSQNLVLPVNLRSQLEHLCHRVQLTNQVDQKWAFQTQVQHSLGAGVGAIALLVGNSGTGKTLAAKAMAQALQTDLFCIDLSLIDATESAQVLQSISDHAPTVLLVKAAHKWLGRSAGIPAATIQQFLTQRRSQPGLTLLAAQVQHSVKLQWQRQCDQVLVFPLPDEATRIQLWQQAFPPQAPVDPTLDWQFLARQVPVSGGEMQAIAREAAFYAAAESSKAKLRIEHILQAWNQKPKPYNSKRK